MGLFMDMITSNNENLKSLLEFDVDDGTENDDEDTNYDSNSDEDDNNSTEDNNDTEDDSGDESDDNTSDDNDSEDSGGSVDPDRLKQIESELFENLSDSQKAIKLKELKNCFIKLYESCDSILEKLNKSTAPNEDITRIFDYISNVLNNLKQYVYDYYTDTFDTRSYMENTAQYQKYLTILSTVRNILEEVKCKRPE